MPSPTIIEILGALLLGFVAGVIVNLLADYLPWRRHFHLTMTSPFASRDIVPVKPRLFPQQKDGRTWPIYLWSGLVAALMRQTVGRSQFRTRRVIVEIGLAIAFAFIAWRFSENRSLGFLMFYAAAFTLIAVIDIEHRWVFLSTIIPVAIVALIECTYWYRTFQDDAIKGGVYGFGIMMALYLLGLVFAQLLGFLTGRRIGRTVLGFGDVYIGALGGLIIGFGALGFALIIMVATGAGAAVWVIIKRWLKSGRYRKYAAIPYGPYILIGMATMLYIPDTVVYFIRRLLNWGV
jgi:prepilin signal peptidase PulO-like enzyme (type II secretory pathway)